jgi:hypothetical protein
MKEKTINSISRAMMLTAGFLALLFTPSCETPPGTGAGVAAVGGLAGTIVSIAMPNSNLGCEIAAGSIALGATMEVINQISEQQRAYLQANSPRTLVIIQRNDNVVKQQHIAAQSNSQESPASKKRVTPLSVDDVMALTAAGVKPEVINNAIAQSKASYSSDEIAKVQQATPPVSPSVIVFMQKSSA